MVERIREFLATTGGKVASGVVLAVALVLAFVSLRSNFGRSDAASLAGTRTYIDASNGKPFEHTLAVGEITPIKAPSGQQTGYPAEACYWTKDGKPKQDPTWVLLNVYSKKPGPTFCQDCGRLVVGHNPPPTPGATPPPTESEYKAHPTESR
jgi:hypothetical protein